MCNNVIAFQWFLQCCNILKSSPKNTNIPVLKNKQINGVGHISMLENRTKCAFCMKYFQGTPRVFRAITSLEFSHSYRAVTSSCSPYTFFTLIKKLAPGRGGLKSWPSLKSFSAVTDCNETCLSLQTFWKGKNSQQNEHSGKNLALIAKWERDTMNYRILNTFL